MTSKSARLHRRQAKTRRKYARLRKEGRLPVHSSAERRQAGVERRVKGEEERRREWWRDRIAGAVAYTVGGVAVASVAATTPVTPLKAADLYRPNPVSAHYNVWVTDTRGADAPDLPHMPEGDATFYISSYAAGTAVTVAWITPDTPRWNSWQWLSDD